ncbi:MAG: hypothetical protein IH585_15115 [Anaerolineaceae bacterium]|nr:hypothetical protein [Anaerolineaceae bacterium]
MNKRSTLVSIILISLLFQYIPVRVVAAEATTEFFASPSLVMPGGEVMFSGFGFTPDSSVDLYLQLPSSEFLGTILTDSAGNFFGGFSLPVINPGTYDVLAAPNDITTTITVMPAMTIDLQPNSGPPGTITHFTANNLLAGQLRLDYDGVPVFGPVDVQAGVFEGDFQIPADRPSTFPQDVALTAFNLVGNQILGRALTFFVAESPLPATYEIQVNDFPQDPVSPGFPFTLQGTISPAPLGPLNLFDLKILWKSGSGQIVPITVGTPQLFSDGSFIITGKAPSLLGGDPLLPSAESGGQVGVVFINKQNGTNSNLQVVPWLDPPNPVFKVKVVDENGDPIQGAIVDVRAFFASPDKQLGGETTSGLTMKNQLNNLEIHPNQITDFIGQASTSESDPFTCQMTSTYGRTNSEGIFEVKIEPEMIAMLGKKVFLGNLPEPVYIENPMTIEFPLYVNATYLGFGNKGLAEPFELPIRFSGFTHLFYNADTNQTVNTNPLVVSLKSLPAGTKITAPIVPKIKPHSLSSNAAPVVGSYQNYVGTGIPMIAFGNFYSFPISQFPNTLFSGDGAVDVEFQYDPALFGALDESNAKFTLEGQVYPFVNKGKKSGQAGCEAVVYKATIPQDKMIRMLPGNHTGLIEISDQAVVPNITKHYIQLNFVAAPTWVLDAKYKEKSIFLGGGNIGIYGYQFPSGDPGSNSNLDTDIPKVGPMGNNVNFNDSVHQYLYPDHTTGIVYDGTVNTKVLDESVWPSKKYNSSVAGGIEIDIPEKTIPVLDTGKFPIYRYVMGIPPIAGATLGADMWFNATLTTSGLIQFLPGGGTSTNMLVFPKATVGVDAFIDLSVLFGLISANAHALPNIGLGMPVSFVNGNLSDSKKCFLYKLDVSWSAKAGICPFCLKKSGTEHIFNGSNPDPCTLPTTANALLDQKLVTVESPPPPTASPALAVDGFGHTLLVWSDDNNNIQSRLMSGGQTIGVYQVSSSMGGIDPQVAFYAPNKAIAVWTESGLASAAESETATLEQIIQAQHLQYALWNGTGWSAPQNLTSPEDSNGEGRVALAGCQSTQPGCSANGEVTAIWVRNTVSNLTERQFHLFSAVFNGATWGSITAIDSTSNGTDAEASVAYSNSGTAQVVWIRDADSDLSTVDDRQIYHRQLTGGSPINALTSLPVAAVEPSLKVDTAGEMILAFTVATDPQALVGNQRLLYAAKQTCGESGCSWSYSALIDSNARPIHAESPVLTMNSNGQAQITYRALGFGAADPGGPTVLPGDPLGTVIGTGEIAQAFVSFSNNTITTIAPTYQNNGGKTVWQPTAVYDSLFNQTYSVSSLGSSPIYSQQMKTTLELMGYDIAAIDEIASPLAFSVNSATSDFSVSSVSPNTTNLQVSGDPLTVVVSISNNGPLFASDRDSGQLEIRLTWDALAGSGEPAGSLLIPIPIEAGGMILAEFSTTDDSLILPAAPHLPHVLYVQVNHEQLIPESNYENNTHTVPIGGLPAPQGLIGAAQPGDSSVFLEWQAVEHEAVAGYRIYRSSDGRIFKPVGSSFGLGFVDLTAVIGESYQYAVVAYAGDGFESDFSNFIQAQVDNTYAVFLPLTMR